MAQPVDGKAYYGYLFETDKKPTKVLDALLRGIANYIGENIGNKEEKSLTPAKLASFYKAVGGNYDSLFVEVPHPSISWIYASIGCQHTLQPTSDDFTPPSIPALTPRGFARWQAIEILLGPEEHVPFIQTAVRNFALTNPDNGEPFPVDLPQEAFPLKPDAEIEKWHSTCADKLRQRATPTEEEPAPDLPPRPKVQAAYVHVRPNRPRAETDYFEPKSRGTTRPVSYQHVPSAGRPVRPTLSRSPTYRARQFLAPEDTEPRLARGRRRSYPENLNSPSPTASPRAGAVPKPDLHPLPRPEHERRHSHPRNFHRYSISSDASSSSEGEDTQSPTTPNHVAPGAAPRRRSHPHSYPEHEQKIRFAPPPTVPGPAPVPTPPDPRVRHRERERERERGRERDDEGKRRSGIFPIPIPIDLSGKLSSQFMSSGKRDRERDREKERDKDRDRRSGSRGGNNVRWKDLYNVDDVWRKPSSRDEEEEVGHSSGSGLGRRGSRDERDTSSGGGRGEYKRRDRDRDREREAELRPRIQPRSRRSSHEDVTRRDRDREREKERDAIGRGTDGRSFRDRDRDKGFVSPIRGVDGRRYPSHS